MANETISVPVSWVKLFLPFAIGVTIGGGSATLASSSNQNYKNGEDINILIEKINKLPTRQEMNQLTYVICMLAEEHNLQDSYCSSIKLGANR